MAAEPAPRKRARSVSDQRKQAVKTGAARVHKRVHKVPAKAVARKPRRRAATPRTAVECLLQELGHAGDPVSVKLLVRQAARVGARLDAIDQLLSGNADAWAIVAPVFAGGKVPSRLVIEVRADNLLVEERNQATLYRHLLGQIQQHRAGLPAPPPEGDKDDDLVD